MRGDDRACRYPPRGVWFGLILAAMTLRAGLAQEALDDAAMRGLRDPVSLAGDRVTHWNGTDGQHWVHLWGNAAVLHGADAGRTRREAIIRISDQSTEFEKIKRVEVYAEGQVRSARNPRVEEVIGRADLRTGEIRLKSYQLGQVFQVKDPPWQSRIIRRSRFLEKKPVANRPSRQETNRDPSPIDSRFELLEKRAAAKAAQTPQQRQVAAVIPTQAVIRNQSDDVVPSLLPSGAMEDDLVPAPGPAPSAATAGPAPATATAGHPGRANLGADRFSTAEARSDGATCDGPGRRCRPGACRHHRRPDRNGRCAGPAGTPGSGAANRDTAADHRSPADRGSTRGAGARPDAGCQESAAGFAAAARAKAASRCRHCRIVHQRQAMAGRRKSRRSYPSCRAASG